MTTPVFTSPVVNAVGEVITAALAAFDPPWSVMDSIDPRQAYASRSLMVGGTWDPEAGENGGPTSNETVLTDTVETGAAGRLTVTTSIECIAYSGGGDDGFAVHREAINDALTAVRTGLRALRTVDGSSARASLSGERWASVLDNGGSGVMALFTVTVTVLP